MRYYDIQAGPLHYTSLVGGKTDPGALNVEVDITVVAVDTPASGSFVRVWGMGIDAISQTQNLFNKDITVRAGMAKGLPLAKPQQAGLLARGTIYQSFGNWIGTDQSLDIIFQPGSNPPQGGGPNPKPPTKNLTLDWKKGTPLSGALQQTLSSGFPDVQVIMDISSSIVTQQDQTAYFPNLEQLGFYCRRMSQDIMGGMAAGVSIVNNNGKIRVFDDTSKTRSHKIDFEDLIGQPTWIASGMIQFKVVMRADINPGDSVTLPNTFINVNTSSTSAHFRQLAFQGTFTVTTLRHVGNYRQATAEAWVTIVEAYTPDAGGGGSVTSDAS